MRELHPLEEIGIEYHVRTEYFDRRVCLAYRHTGRAIPMDKWEHIQVNKNAAHELVRATQAARTLFGAQGAKDIKYWIRRTGGHPQVEFRVQKMQEKHGS